MLYWPKTVLFFIVWYESYRNSLRYYSESFVLTFVLLFSLGYAINRIIEVVYGVKELPCMESFLYSFEGENSPDNLVVVQMVTGLSEAEIKSLIRDRAILLFPRVSKKVRNFFGEPFWVPNSEEETLR